jgi:hypothetical protein
MKRLSCFVFVLLVFIAWLASPDTDAQQTDQIQNDKELQQLLSQRRGVLKERFDIIKAGHDDGRHSYKRVISAQDMLLNAELELASTKADRIEIYRKRIENFRFLEELATARVKKALATADEKLLATANRIQAEIDCIRVASKP